MKNNLWIFCALLQQVRAIQPLLLPSGGIHCNKELELAFDIAVEYFKRQHSFTILDFSPEPITSTFVCTDGTKFMSYYQFDAWTKVNLGAKIAENGLSSYSTTRGFFLKFGIIQALILIPLVADHNPAARVMISLVDGTYDQARMLLKVAYDDFKMLDVIIVMFFSDYENGKIIGTNITQCLYNPFEGSEHERFPKFECFNTTQSDTSLNKIESFIQHRTKNLHRYPLRVHIYEEILLSRAVLNPNGGIDHYKYVDGDSITQISRLMNFTPVYVHDTGNAKDGYKLPNGTFIGSIGAIENDIADLTAIPSLIAEHKTTKALYLNSIAMKKLYFMIQKRKVFRIIILSALFNFDGASKAIAIILFIMLPCIFVAVNRLESKIMKYREQPVGRNLLVIIGILLNISSKLSTLSASRVVTGMILFYILMISSIFQGSIIKNLNENKHVGDIQTIDELIKENYKLIMDQSLAFVLKSQGGSVLGDRLKALSENPENVVESSVKGFEKVSSDKFTALLVPDMLIEILNLHYDDETFEDTFEFIPEPAFEFYVAPMVQKNSPFIQTFNIWFSRYRESGFQQYQVARAVDDTKNVLIRRCKLGHFPKTSDKFLCFNDMISVFDVYGVCIFFSTLVFLAELLWKFLSLKLLKKPLLRSKVVPDDKEENLLEFVL